MDPEQSMKPDFRVSREAFNSLLAILHQEKDHGWGHHLEVLMFVHWLAHGISYVLTTHAFDIPKSTVHRAVHKIARRIRKAKNRVICFPPENTLEEVGRGFARLARHECFSKAVGAIDGSHIRIKPPKKNKKCYYNYKSFHSIQLQAICDSEGKFLDIFVGYPGSAHDTRILRNSPVYHKSLYPPPGYFLLGDAGYPCIDQPIPIIVPFKKPPHGPMPPMHVRFNKMHGRARCIIESTFGRMKGRWRATLFKALEVRPGFVSEIALACAFLHNMCLANGDILDEDPEEPQPEEPDPPAPLDQDIGDRESSGNYIRDRMCAQISAPRQLHRLIEDHDYADIWLVFFVLFL